MAQDAKGYMWFTGTSLYRYDGYRVVTFKHDPNNINLFQLRGWKLFILIKII
jgi:hypothetical protein